MTDVVVRERLAGARGFVFDMDGTLVLGDRTSNGLRPLPGALEITRWAVRRGRPYVVFTRGRALAIAVGTGLGLTASYDGLPLSRRPHLQVRGLEELLEMLGDADAG